MPNSSNKNKRPVSFGDSKTETKSKPSSSEKTTTPAHKAASASRVASEEKKSTPPAPAVSPKTSSGGASGMASGMASRMEEEKASKTSSATPATTKPSVATSKTETVFGAGAATKSEAKKALRPMASVRFTPGWGQVAKGPIVAGGQLTIEYDPNRAQLRECQSGMPSWGVQAYIKTLPSGVIVEKSAIDFEIEKGKKTEAAKPVPVTVDVPPGTTEIEVWFRNWAGADSPKETWDSNFGRNYRFRVEA